MSAAERIRAENADYRIVRDHVTWGEGWGEDAMKALDRIFDERVRFEAALREIAASKPWGRSAVENTARAYRAVDIAREALAGSASTETSERSGT